MNGTDGDVQQNQRSVANGRTGLNSTGLNSTDGEDLLCLDVPTGQAANHPIIQLWECNGHTNQLWLWGGPALKPANGAPTCSDAFTLRC
jgi:hypothetical protein